MGVKASTSSPIPEPRKGASIIAHIGRLIRYMKNERLSFGYGFTVEPRAGGKMVNYMPPGGFKSFTVYRAGSDAIAIRGGYAQTQTGTLTAVSDVATVSVSANMAVFARYDLGLAGTSTPRWEVVSGSIIQTDTALPTYDARYRVVPISAVTWDGTSTAISGIVQHHTGTLPCPDMEPAGTVKAWSGAVSAVPHGYALCDGSNGTPDLEGRFILAARVDTADGTDTIAVGDSGGTRYNVTGTHTHAQDAQRAGDLYMSSGTVTATPGTYRFPDSDIPIDNDGHSLPYYALAYIQHL